jgi:7-carboxy-7-deazaguanine synthase
MHAAYVAEIFSSIEGEGLNSGSPATFVRFAGCNLSCSFCDTTFARQRAETAPVHLNGGRLAVRNPVPSGDIVGLIEERFPHTRTVILTGGEPLLQVAPLRELARELRLRGRRVHLETNGSLPEAMAAVRDVVDFVCMDVKLRSTQDGRDLMQEHAGFLRAMDRVKAAVKIVITNKVSPAEFVEAGDMIAACNPYIPVLLQPAFSGSVPCMGGEALLRFQAMAGHRLHDIRISLQMHKVLDIR